MIFHLDDLLLFPLSFGVMVLQKTYSVSRSALIPHVVNNKTELVEANSKLGLISGAIGALAAAPAGALAAISPKLSLLFGVAMFGAAVISASSLPRGAVLVRAARLAEPPELQKDTLRSAAVAMSLIRAVIGFLFFELLFWLRENSYSNLWIGLVIGASTSGLMLGNGLAAPLRGRLREELMLTAAIVMIAVGGIGAAAFGGVGAAIALAGIANLASGIGRMAFDSIVPARRARRQPGAIVRQVRDPVPAVVGGRRRHSCAVHVPWPGCVPGGRLDRCVGGGVVHPVLAVCGRVAGRGVAAA